MNEACIPVDLFNPGQVFACLGFLEAAEVLLGDAEGGFDWSDPGQTLFHLAAAGDDKPTEVVLKFLNRATVSPVSPMGIAGPWPQDAAPSEVLPSPLSELLTSDKKGYTASALPFSVADDGNRINVSNWLEGDGRKALKLFAGKQVAAQLMRNVLLGDTSKPGTQGIRQLSPSADDPFQVAPVGGRFGYDSRGAWDAIHAGFSPDAQGAILRVSPVVEALAIIGLEHARPEFLSTYEIRYAAWQGSMPVSLARVAFTHPEGFVPREHIRIFRAYLGDDKQYKKCFPATFSQLEHTS